MSHQVFARVAIGVLAMILWGGGGPMGALAEGDLLGDPAMATAEDPSSLTVGTENPDNMVAPTQSLSSLEGSTHPLPAPTPTENPASLVAGTVTPSSLEGQTYALESLPSAAAQERQARADALRNVEQHSPSLPTPQTLAEAQSRLADAQTRLAAANSAVGTMIRRDYPTGQARLQIYDEQQNAKDAVFEAQGWVRDFGGTPQSSSLGDP